MNEHNNNVPGGDSQEDPSVRTSRSKLNDLAASPREVLEYFLLVGDGIALALLFIITAQALVQCRDFLLPVHGFLLSGSRVPRSETIIAQAEHLCNARLVPFAIFLTAPPPFCFAFPCG